jgi:hypothetical protein
MLSWGVIGYGAALSALAATVLVGFAGRERRPAVLACAAVSALLVAIGWNAILHTTHADQFFHDAPIPARRLALLAVLTGLGALLVEIYLY